MQVAGCDTLPTTVDSSTRTHRWAKADEGLERSRETGQSELNGYPIVAHGGETTRDIVGRLDRPMRLRAAAPDLRLVAELAFASGFSAIVTNPLFIWSRYAGDQPLGEIVSNWQYIDRLISEYERAGAPLAVDLKPMAGSVPYPPSLAIAGIVLDGLILAEQGVKNFTVTFRAHGNFVQAASHARVLDSLTRDVLARHGHSDVAVYLTSTHWQGAWPDAVDEGHAVMTHNTVEAVLAGANGLEVKTP